MGLKGSHKETNHLKGPIVILRGTYVSNYGAPPPKASLWFPLHSSKKCTLKTHKLPRIKRHIQSGVAPDSVCDTAVRLLRTVS